MPREGLRRLDGRATLDDVRYERVAQSMEIDHSVLVINNVDARGFQVHPDLVIVDWMLSGHLNGVQIFLGGEFSIRNIHRHDDL